MPDRVLITAYDSVETEPVFHCIVPVELEPEETLELRACTILAEKKGWTLIVTDFGRYVIDPSVSHCAVGSPTLSAQVAQLRAGEIQGFNGLYEIWMESFEDLSI